VISLASLRLFPASDVKRRALLEVEQAVGRRDVAGGALDRALDTFSAQQMAGLGVWDSTANLTGWTALLGDARGGPDVSPYAAPARATDLSGLPPAFIDVGSAETFRDEDITYAGRIWQAGGRAELHVWPGCFHGFDAMAPQAAISLEARAARVRWLHRLLDA